MSLTTLKSLLLLYRRLCICLCLSVCAQDIKKLSTSFDEIFTAVGCMSGNTDQDAAAGILKEFLPLRARINNGHGCNALGLGDISAEISGL